MNKLENNDSGILRALYRGYEKLGQFLFHVYSLTSVNKGTSVLLNVTNNWTSSQVKYKNDCLNIFENTKYMRTIPLIKS